MMFRAALKNKARFALIYPLNVFINPNDRVVNEETESKIELMPGEIAIDRLKNMFRIEKDGRISSEIQSILSTTFFGGIVGMFVGGLINARNTPTIFMEQNEATRFTDKLDAQRQLQRKVTIDFARGGTKMAGKLAFFSFIFGCVSTSLNVYDGKPAIPNYTCAGAVTGFLFKMNLGLKGAFSGAVIGSAFGTICGTLSLLVLYTAGVSIDEIYRTQSNWLQSRNDTEKSLKIKDQLKDEIPLVKKLLNEENLKMETHDIQEMVEQNTRDD